MKHLILPLLFCLQLRAQGPQNLVFEGAGIRGIAYAGAIEVLEQQGMLSGVQRIGGTSAGAITALLLSLRYPSAEITRIVNSTPYRKFNDGRFSIAGGINRMKKYFGWYRGRQFEKWLARLIANKTGNADISFEDLHRLGYPDLYITGTSLDLQRTIVFSHESFPKMRVRDAVRISMSIPLYFEAVFMTPEGRLVAHPKQHRERMHVMVDGGITANFPIHLFDSSRYLPEGMKVHPGTLGFRIDNRQQIVHDSLGLPGLAHRKIDTFNDYLKAFYSVMVENLNRADLGPADWQRTVAIDDGDLSPRIRKLSRSELALLLGNGRAAMEEWLRKRKAMVNSEW